MTKTQKKCDALRKEHSELRERLNTIRLMPESEETAEIKAEKKRLDARAISIEPETRAAHDELEAEQATTTNGDAEARALRQLTGRANIGSAVESVFLQRATTGALAELQQHHGLALNEFPVDMLRDEHRAVATAPTDTGAVEEPTLQPVFATGDAAFLGFSQPTVAAGDAVFPVLTTRPAVGGPHTDSTEVAETTGSFTADGLAPGRLQASYSFRRSDAIRFSSMDEALRTALAMGLSEAVDAQAMARIVTDVTRTNRTSVSDYAHYKAVITGRVDGRFAMSESDVRAVMGTATFTHASTTYKSSESDESSVDAIRRLSGGLRVSAHVAAVASNRQDALIKRGMRADAVAPMWMGVQLIVDDVTRAKQGEIIVTAALFSAFKILRTGGFARIQTQHA